MARWRTVGHMQVSLDDEHHARVKQKAAELGVTIGDYIRMLVERDLGSPTTKAGVDDIFALGDSGASDIVTEPTAIADAIASRQSR